MYCRLSVMVKKSFQLFFKLGLTISLLAGISKGLQAQVIAGFSADSTEGCEQLIVNFTDLSTGPVTSWSWAVYNESGSVVGFSPLSDPSFVFDAVGTYDVELTVCGASGCNTLYETAYLTIYDAPDVLFTASAFSGCPPLNVSFTDVTTYPGGSPVSRFWVIEGGPLLPGTGTINYTFNAPGVYEVLLFVEDDNGCSAFYQDSVEVFAPPVVSISGSPLVACNPPLTTNFLSLVSGAGPYAYNWIFGDGGTAATANPSHTYTATGTYTVSLSATDSRGCTATVTAPAVVQIYPADVQFSTSTPVACTGQPFSFLNTSLPSSGSWVWNFGDGSPVSNLFSPTHTYTTPGTYTVTLNGSFGTGCSGSFSTTINVVDPPTTDFSESLTQDCQVPTTVDFTAIPGPGVTGYLWNFGDGGTSTLPNPSHTYTAFGTYTVSLTVFNASGCSFTITKPSWIRIRELEPAFETDVFEGCAPLTVAFNDTSVTPTPVVSWLWDFGTGATATGSSPSYTYNDPGCYDVTLTITTASGCTATETFDEAICAGRSGTALFGLPDTSCPAVTVDVFTAGLDEIIVLVDGAFQTTLPSPGATTQIPFVPPGFRELTLISVDNGCTDTFVQSIFILIPLDSIIEVIQDCANPLTITAIISPELADSSCGWEWILGDGSIIANVDTLIYTYAAPGFYSVSIDVFCIEELACRELAAGGITLTQPAAFFSPNNEFSCDFPAPIIFNNFSSDGYLNNLTYAWTFGDGGTSFVRSPTRNYTSAGTFPVSMTITDVNGCTATHRDTVYISGLQADLEWEALCEPLQVAFTDASLGTGGDVVSWFIDFGDGSTELITAPDSLGTLTHTYPFEGSFDVLLAVTNIFGCTDSFEVEVDNIFLSANFNVDDPFPCAGDTIQFSNLSIGTGLSYLWDFGAPGGGDTSTAFSPSYAYVLSGTFSPSLTITDVNDCSSTLTLDNFITVDTMEVEPFTWSALIENCNFALVEFLPSPTDTADACSYFWSFGDGGTSVERSPIYPYILAGEYNVSLTITNCNGCSDTRTISNAVKVIGPFGNFGLSQDSICAGQAILFNTNVVKTDSIFLFAGNGDVFSMEIPFSDSISTHILSYAYPLPGIYTPQIVVKDSTGCFQVLRGDTVFVGFPPDVAIDLPEDSVCLGIPLALVDASLSADSVSSVRWVFSDTTLSGLYQDTTWYLPPAAGVYNFALVIETPFGCVDSAFGALTVFGLPAIALTPDTSVCPGLAIQLEASGGVAYAWTPAESLNDPTIANPLATPFETTTYSVVVDDGFCTDSAQVTLEVLDELPMSFGQDASLCAGGSAPLFVAFPDDFPGSVIWVWEPALSLDDPSSPNPTASPSATTTYQISASCGDLINSGEVTITVNQLPEAFVVPSDTTIFPGESVELPAGVLGGGGLFTYNWSPPVDLNCTDCATVISTPGGDIEYTVVVTDQFGCSNSASAFVRLRGACGPEVFEIPNIITPNGDGANDEFVFRFEGIREILSVRVFDRWGDVVFETQDIETRWNGTFRGGMCTPGVYVYTIEAVCENQVRTVVAGNITLIR